MTIASGDTIASLKRVLREHGLRATIPRVAVLQALDDRVGHQSMEEIARAVEARYPAFDRVSIYRTLETFESVGLAYRAVLQDKVIRWERAARAHHHVVCRQCAAVLEVDDAPFRRLAENLEQAYGVRVDVRHLALHGLCAHCAAVDAS